MDIDKKIQITLSAEDVSKLVADYLTNQGYKVSPKNLDWKIHKRLEEARRVYIYPARGSGKSQLEQVFDPIVSDKDVYVTTKADIPKQTPSIEQIKETILDWDLQCIPSWRTNFRDESWEYLKRHYILVEPCDENRHMWIRTNNPYGLPWII